MQKIIPISDLQRQSGQIVGALSDDGEPVIITHRGRAAAVLVSAERFAQIESDLARLDELEMESLISRAEAEIAAGNTVSHEAVKERFKTRKESGKAIGRAVRRR
jgi:prevent-host-death family protein